MTESGVKVYVVWVDPDPGYSVSRILGVFSTKEAADQRLVDAKAEYDSGVLELTLDDAADEGLSA